MRFSVQLEMPDPDTSAASQPPSPEEQVRNAVDLVESGYCSDTEWLLLNKLYQDLCERPETPRIRNLLQMVEPVLSKYGYHGTSATGGRSGS